jgi:hypothetical protein
MKDLISTFLDKLQLPSVVFYLRVLNIINKIKWAFSLNKKIINSSEYANKIALIALFEKGQLRNDIKNLIESLKDKGFYVVGINTLKLDNECTSFFDTYIQRYNYGRDFGSYKLGFLEIFKIIKKNKISPSVLMLNDSVFYSYKNINSFIEKMADNNFEITGATENYEIEHHIGSFCINFSSKIVQNKKFIKYWKSYKLSDMRPTVIKKGEMGLSKIIKKCVSSPDQINILYSINKFIDFIKNNEEILLDIFKYSRKSNLTGWEVLDINKIHKQVLSYIKNSTQFGFTDNKESKLDIDIIDIKLRGISNFNDYMSYLQANNVNLGEDLIKRVFKQNLFLTFVSGSQIHQNYGLNYIMGCGILKNDAIYRGMYDYQDLVNMEMYLDPKDYHEYKEILLRQQFGESTLIGWKRVAFNHGYI